MARGVTTDLIWRFLSDTKSLERGSRKAGQAMGDVRSSTGRMEKGLGVATRALGTLGIALGARELLNFAGDAVSAAKQADAVATSFDKVFGPAAAQLRGQLDQTRQSLGLSTAEMEGALVTTGALAVGMGLSAVEAAEMSGGMFDLAGDMATFNPLAGDVNQALGALQAAIRGEFDPLERFGAKLSAAEVKERALADTGKTNEDQLTQTDLAMATYRLTLKKTVVQQGALADAQADGKTEAAELEAKMKDLTVVLGEQMTPTANNLMGILTNLAGSTDLATESSAGLFQGVQNVTGVMRTATSKASLGEKAFSLFGQGIGVASDSAGTLLGWLPPVSQWLHTSAETARRESAPAFGELNVEFGKVPGNVGNITAAAGPMADSLDDVAEASEDITRTALDEFMYDLQFGARDAAAKMQDMASAAQRARQMADQLRPAVQKSASAASSAAGAFSRFAYQLSRTVTQSQRVRQFGPGQGHLIAQSGKTIPGRPGSPQMVLAHAGETIQTAAQTRQHEGNGGGDGRPHVTINVTGAMMDPQGAAKAVAEAMRRYERTNGRV